MLDSSGFKQAESHLNEWNYLPNNDWGVFGGTPAIKERWYADMGGPAAAAFTLSALLALDRSPVDVACFYSGDSHGFGVFTQHGQPRKPFYAHRAFRELVNTPNRLAMDVTSPGGLELGAGRDEKCEAVNFILSAYRTGSASLRLRFRNLPWSGGSVCEVVQVDREHDWHTNTVLRVAAGPFTLMQDVPDPGLLVVRVRQAPAEP
jgi:hypothetical protein